MEVNPKSLLEKVTPSASNTLEAATGLCSLRTHHKVESEHYLTKALETGGGDFDKIRRHFGIDDVQLSADLLKSLDAFKSGSGRPPTLSPPVEKLLLEAWTVGSLEFAQAKIRTGTIILDLVADPELAYLVHRISPEFQKIDVRLLHAGLIPIVAGSPEDAESSTERLTISLISRKCGTIIAAENKRLREIR